MKKRTKILYFLGILFVFILVFQSQVYRFKGKKEISSEIKEKLSQLGKKALLTKDVPVSAILFYKDSIIGVGYNTVNKDSVLSGHAEINALNMAFKSCGNLFSKLNRADLKLYSSFEPCEMCKGAIIHYNIKNVYFERTKPGISQIKSTFRSLIYELSKKRIDADSLQEKLFLRHPDYKK